MGRFMLGVLVGWWAVLLVGFLLALWLHVRKEADAEDGPPTLTLDDPMVCVDCDEEIDDLGWFVATPGGFTHVECLLLSPPA